MTAEPPLAFAPARRRQRIALIALLILPVAAVGLGACFGLAAIVRSVVGEPQDLDLPGYITLAAPALSFGFVAFAAILIYFRFEYGWRRRSFAAAFVLDALVLLGAKWLWPH